MATILITGVSGFVGSHLAARAAAEHEVIALSRQPVVIPDVESIAGDFASEADLDRLGDRAVDVVVHLAGVTGAAGEEDAMTVNVAGTRRLMRWAIDRGVRRFVLARSIAAAGCLAPDFLPRELPIPDDHPCDSSNVYGVSKAMIEQLADYFSRVTRDLEVVLFRIGVVIPQDAAPVTEADVDGMRWPFCDLGIIAIDDVVEAFSRAIGTPLGAGVRRMNLVAPQPRTPLPTAETIRRIMGPLADRLDLSFYDRPGAERAGVYAVDRLRETYGLTARTDVRTLTRSTS
jgi:nucleoside-diphosphate-sugar epimerase